jgi:hypothetical protein
MEMREVIQLLSSSNQPAAEGITENTNETKWERRLLDRMVVHCRLSQELTDQKVSGSRNAAVRYFVFARVFLGLYESRVKTVRELI